MKLYVQKDWFAHDIGKCLSNLVTPVVLADLRTVVLVQDVSHGSVSPAFGDTFGYDDERTVFVTQINTSRLEQCRAVRMPGAFQFQFCQVD